MTIWKFPLKVVDEQIVETEYPGEALSVQIQSGTPCLWALVDPHSSMGKVKLRVRTFGTGNPIDTAAGIGQFVGTYQLEGGSLVFHVFVLRDRT